MAGFSLVEKFIAMCRQGEDEMWLIMFTILVAGAPNHQGNTKHIFLYTHSYDHQDCEVMKSLLEAVMVPKKGVKAGVYCMLGVHV